MKILFYLFCFYFLSTFLLCQDEDICKGFISLSDCLNQKCCFANNKCFALNGNNYREFKSYFNTNLKPSEEYKNVIFDQIKCNLDSFKCRQKFSNDIKENCFKIEKSEDEQCCYMTLDFKYNKKHECYPANKNEVKKIIDDLEKEYYGIKSVKIKCDKSQYITFGFFLLFNILFLF